MKNYFYKIIFACFLTATSYSQQVNNTEFKTKTLQVFQNLDKTRVPHGILLDFGMEFTNLKAFNGTLTDSTFTTSQTMSDIYKTLLMCRVRSNVTTGFITPEEYATRWYTQRTKGVIVLSGNYFKYNNFVANAYPNKLNYSNNQFSDKFVGSTWQNPYEEQNLFAIAPAIESYKGLNFKVKLPTNLFLSNYPATNANIQIDFSDGLGYRIVALDQLVDVNYTQPNTYVWKYKITLTNGQTLLSHSKILIENGLNATEIATPCTTCHTSVPSQALAAADPNLASYFKKTITATTPYLGSTASATIYVRYALGGNTIRRPLIVAEGFDEGIILKREQEAGSNSIKDFLLSVDISRSQSLALENEINSYDVIYVDWDNGVTFLQRNAYALEEVIKWVNQNKTTTTQNVVLGQSMGGLIARYALKDMENRGLPHDTRLYVSHDAPHLGANTPVSAQLSARHLRNVYVSTPIPLLLGEIVLPLAFDFAQGFAAIVNQNGGNITVPPFVTPLQGFSLADTAATRQLSYNWVNCNYGINNDVHNAWQQELANMGYPTQTRNIAIANGSECGITQTDNGNILSYVREAGRIKYLSDYVNLLDAVYGTFLSNPVISVVALLPGRSYWKMDFQSRYMNNLNENKNIYHGYLGYKKKVFWFIPVSIAVTELDVNQPTGVLPFDIYGGGQQRTDPRDLPVTDITSNSFGFIPTASSLDIGKYITPINDTDYRRSFVGGQPPVAPKNSPFQNFVTGFVLNNPNSSNSRHISFNTRNGNWLQRELNPTINNPIQVTDCSYICSDSKILGPELVCSPTTFSAPVVVPNNNWTITQGASLVSLTGNGTSNIILTALPDVSGQVTMSLTLGDGTLNRCGERTLTKTVWVGKPSFALEYSYNEINTVKSTLCVISSNPNFSTFQQGITNVKFKYLNSSTILQNSISGCRRTTNPFCMEVIVTNICGSTTLVYDCFNRQNSVTNTYKVYPNPSKDIVNIDLREENNLPEKGATISGELFDMMGQSKSKVQIKDNKAVFSVLGLSRGIYVLKIYINDQVESHQIAVE